MSMFLFVEFLQNAAAILIPTLLFGDFGFSINSGGGGGGGGGSSAGGGGGGGDSGGGGSGG